MNKNNANVTQGTPIPGREPLWNRHARLRHTSRTHEPSKQFQQPPEAASSPLLSSRKAGRVLAVNFPALKLPAQIPRVQKDE